MGTLLSYLRIPRVFRVFLLLARPLLSSLPLAAVADAQVRYAAEVVGAARTHTNAYVICVYSVENGYGKRVQFK